MLLTQGRDDGLGEGGGGPDEGRQWHLAVCPMSRKPPLMCRLPGRAHYAQTQDTHEEVAASVPLSKRRTLSNNAFAAVLTVN